MEAIYFKIHQRAAADEDAPPVAEDDMVIVCDGLGGTGICRHQICDKPGESVVKKSAWIAPRIVSNLSKNYFCLEEESIWNNPECFLFNYKKYLCNQLNIFIQDQGIEKTIRGSSVKLLPTTLAAGIVREDPYGLQVAVIWAGDSRVYLLSPKKGLMQLTEDDVDGTFNAMTTSTKMNNCITGEGEDTFRLNYSNFKLSKDEIGSNAILFACTDGVFDFMPTPMILERSILAAFMNIPDDGESEDIERSLSALYQGSTLHDDTTIAGMVLDYTDIGTLKLDYGDRYHYISNICKEEVDKPVLEKIRLQEAIDEDTLEINKALRALKPLLTSEISRILNDPNHTDDFISLFEPLNEKQKGDSGQSEREFTSPAAINQMEEALESLEEELKEVFLEDLSLDYETILNNAQSSRQNDRLVKAVKKYAEMLPSLTETVQQFFQDLLSKSCESDYIAVLTDWVINTGKYKSWNTVMSECNKFAQTQKLYLKTLDSSDGKRLIGALYANAKATDFQAYINRKGYERSNALISRIKRLREKLESAKARGMEPFLEKKDYSGFPKLDSNADLLKLISLPNIKTYISVDASNKITDLRNRLVQLKKHKAEKSDMEQKLWQVWENYRVSYEHYRHTYKVCTK